jgi:polysaccharide biosynthesis/export protein
LSPSPSAEQVDVPAKSNNAQEQALLAMASTDYLVTPGDILILKYLKISSLESLSFIVEGDGIVNLGIFGRLQSSGMRYRDLKAFIEKKVGDAYRGSSPSLLISSVGIFTVTIEGETPAQSRAKAWGLLRLSDVLKDAKTPYSSTRKIKIISQDGKTNEYDLFRAIRGGDLAQNPYLRPGDRIVLSKAERIVKLTGEIRRPDSYELLPGDRLGELVELYGDSFTALADTSRITLIRHTASRDPAGEKILLNYPQEKDYVIQDQDEVSVASTQDLMPVVYFEGAIGVGVQGQSPQTSQRAPYSYYPGETLGSAVRKLRDQFSAVSDLSNSYIIRGTARIPVDLSKYLYDEKTSLRMELARNDIIIIPFRQFFVSVSGAVKLPGRYPYIPDRSWAYYIGLAGGFDTDRNSKEKLEILDIQGRPKSKDKPIEPEDTLTAASNSFLYYVGKISPVITTVLGVISTTFTTYYYFQLSK